MRFWLSEQGFEPSISYKTAQNINDNDFSFDSKRVVSDVQADA